MCLARVSVGKLYPTVKQRGCVPSRSVQLQRRVACVWAGSRDQHSAPCLASPLLLTYLSALGWRDGQTLEVVDRQAEGDTSKLPRLAAEIVAARPDVIA
jgi:hypothetical protein